jgi:hypothetical protein
MGHDPYDPRIQLNKAQELLHDVKDAQYRVETIRASIEAHDGEMRAKIDHLSLIEKGKRYEDVAVLQKDLPGYLIFKYPVQKSIGRISYNRTVIKKYLFGLQQVWNEYLEGEYKDAMLFSEYSKLNPKEMEKIFGQINTLLEEARIDTEQRVKELDVQTEGYMRTYFEEKAKKDEERWSVPEQMKRRYPARFKPDEEIIGGVINKLVRLAVILYRKGHVQLATNMIFDIKAVGE